MRTFTLYILFGILLASINRPTALAADFLSPRIFGLGGASHASPLFTDSVYLNPSFIALMPIKSFSMAYLNYRAENVFSFAGQIGSNTSPIQSGIGVTRYESSTAVNLGLSKSFFDRVALGLGAKYLEGKFDGSISFSAIVTNSIRVAVIADNLAESQGNLGYLRELIFGTRFSPLPYLQIYFDPLWVPSNSDSQWGYQVGAEVNFLNDGFFRLGRLQNASLQFIPARGDGWSAGLGWQFGHFTLDYGLGRITTLAGGWANTIGITLFF